MKTMVSSSIVVFCFLCLFLLQPVFAGPDEDFREAITLLENGKLEEALVKYEAAITVNPRLLAQDDRGLRAELVKKYENLVKASPDDTSLRLKYADFLNLSGESQKALNEYQFVVANSKDENEKTRASDAIRQIKAELEFYSKMQEAPPAPSISESDTSSGYENQQSAESGGEANRTDTQAPPAADTSPKVDEARVKEVEEKLARAREELEALNKELSTRKREWRESEKDYESDTARRRRQQQAKVNEKMEEIKKLEEELKKAKGEN